MDKLESFAWPASQLDEAIRVLAQKSGFLSGAESIPPPTEEERQGEALSQWLERAASQLALELELVDAPYYNVETMLRQAAPALLRLPNKHFLLLVKRLLAWPRLAIIHPDGSIHRVDVTLIRAALCQSLEAAWLPEIEQFLSELDLPKERWPDASRAMLRERLYDSKVGNCWLLRLSYGAKLSTLIRHARLPHYLLLSIAGLVIQYCLYLGTWALVGLAALKGRIELAWLLAALLLWFSGLPFLALKFWLEKLISLELSTLIKQRLFYGVLRLDFTQVKQTGIGQFLAWVMESERLEEAGLRGGIFVISSIISLLVMALALFGVGATLMGILLLCWLLITALVVWQNFQTYLQLNEAYNNMTNELLERLQGHSTRLIQETNWYEEEDQALADYLVVAKTYDRNRTRLLVIIPNGWAMVGLLGIATTFIFQPEAFITLGISFLVMLLVYQQLEILAWGSVEIIRALTAWQLIQPLNLAATRESNQGTQSLLESERPAAGQLILEAWKLCFRYQTRQQPILEGCKLEIYAGDRLLLEGPSGEGKSTLASLLIGLNTLESGVLLLHDLDQHTIGEKAWRKRVVSAPQFYENHILNATFAFNLLMGRKWPPTEQDLAEAEEICRELGLGDLLNRMPAGIQQMVGNAGWRLSHGERSRLYIARALLQKADLIILDESFASLDPENMEIALRCVLKRAPTLLVIAHP